MEPHSLVLLSGSTLDACHHTHLHGTQTRRVNAVPPRQPLRNFAQGLARLLPQLRHLSRRLRRTTASTSEDGNAAFARTRTAAADDDLSSSSPSCSIANITQQQPQHHRQPRWRAPRWRRAPHTKLQHAQTAHQQQAVLPQLQLRNLPGDQSQVQLRSHSLLLKQVQQHHLQHHQEELHHPQEQSQVQHQVQVAAYTHIATTAETNTNNTLSTTQRHRGALRRLGRLLGTLGKQMRPQGPGENDKNFPERILNVVTCGMFFQAGGKIVRLCHSLAARRFGWAFLAVGVIATLYHSSWGRVRPLARKVDYYSIAMSSLLLRSAVVGPVPGWLAAAILAAIPFKPTLISTSNFMAVEVRYLLLALSQRHLLGEWVAHTGMSVAATVCFTLEDTPLLAWFPYTHAAFHALSAAAFLTLPSALNHLTGP